MSEHDWADKQAKLLMEGYDRWPRIANALRAIAEREYRRGQEEMRESAAKIGDDFDDGVLIDMYGRSAPARIKEAIRALPLSDTPATRESVNAELLADKEKIAWLVERTDLDAPVYLSLGLGNWTWTRKIEEATKFADFQSARWVRDSRRETFLIEVREHSWPEGF